MNDMNQIILVGNVGKVETRAAGSTGQFACNFSVATQHGWKDKTSGQWKNETTWHNCIKWLKHETDAPQKGERIFVEGTLSTRSYDKDGQTKYITEVKVKNMMAAPKSELAPLPVAPTFDGKGAFNELDTLPF